MRRGLLLPLASFPKLELFLISPTTLSGVIVAGPARLSLASEKSQEAIYLAQMLFPHESSLSCDLSQIAYVAAAGLLHDTTSHVQRKRDIQRKTPSLRVQELAGT